MGTFFKIITAAILLLAVLFAVACSVRPIKSSEEDLKAVAKCGEYEIPYEQIRYLAVSHKAIMEDEFGKGIWENEETALLYGEELKTRIEDDIKTYTTVLTVCDRYNIHMDDEEIQDAIQEEMEYVVKEMHGGMKKYKEDLEESAMTDSFFRFLYGIYYCQNELYLLLTDALGVISAPKDDNELYELLKSQLYRTSWVYLPYTYGGKTKEENKAKIDDVYERLHNGKISFSQAMYECGTDNTLSDGGNYYLRGYAHKALENAVLSVGEGEFSEAFEMSGAFYIVQREEVNPQYILSNLYSLKSQYLSVKFNEFLSKVKDSLTVTYLEDINLIKIK